jgi:DNA-binding IclR family transcriptional regulator
VRDDQDKTYRLGPSLITLGQIAQEALRVNPAARDELAKLSTAFGTTAALSAVVDDRITLLELVGPQGVDLGVRVGQSYPFTPPVGLMFVLWDDEALTGWLAKTPTVPLRTDTERLKRVVVQCRSSGYLVEKLTPAGRRLYALMAGIPSDLPDELRALLGELISDIGERVYLRSESESGRQRHDVNVISAPVFDRHRRQAMVISLHIGRALTDTEISRHARGLIAAADALTAQLGGAKAR